MHNGSVAVYLRSRKPHHWLKNRAESYSILHDFSDPKCPPRRDNCLSAIFRHAIFADYTRWPTEAVCVSHPDQKQTRVRVDYRRCPWWWTTDRKRKRQGWTGIVRGKQELINVKEGRKKALKALRISEPSRILCIVRQSRLTIYLESFIFNPKKAMNLKPYSHRMHL